MTPGEIRACYRLYVAHRKSHEICTFPRTATVIAGDLGDHAVLLRLHTGHGDPNGGLRPALTGHVGHFGKMLASFGAQLSGRGALIGR